MIQDSGYTTSEGNQLQNKYNKKTTTLFRVVVCASFIQYPKESITFFHYLGDIIINDKSSNGFLFYKTYFNDCF